MKWQFTEKTVKAAALDAMAHPPKRRAAPAHATVAAKAPDTSTRVSEQSRIRLSRTTVNRYHSIGQS